MAKKIIKKEEKIIKIPFIKEDIINKAKEKGCPYDSLVLIEEWIRLKHFICVEIFYSMYHKQWSVNNYFIDLRKGKKISWEDDSTRFTDYSDALALAVWHLLKAI